MRRLSRPRKSSTASPDSGKPAETSVAPPSRIPLPLEVVLNPGHLLKDALELSSEVPTTIGTDNPVLSVLQDMVEGMQSGSNIEDLRVPLLQLTNNQEERAKLVRSLILTNDYNRLSKYLIIRDSLEKLMLAHAIEGSLTPAEGMSFLRVVREEIDNIQGSVTEGAAAGGDVTTMLNRVSFAAKAQEDILASKIKSSPQNRELVRKLIYRLTKLTTRGKASPK